MGEPLRGRRRRRTTALVAGMTLCVAGGGAVVAGFAAGLGPLSSKSLGAWTRTAPAVVPTVIACDDFDTGDGVLAGRPVSGIATCGAEVWAVHQGAWAVGSGVATADGTADATASLETGTSDATIDATVGGANTDSRRAGVVLDHDGAATYLAAVIVGDATVHVDLVLVVAGTPITLDTASVVVGSPAVLSLTRHGSVATVRVDGATALAYTLAPAEIATLNGGTRAGLYASSTSTTFDDLTVSSPLV